MKQVKEQPLEPRQELWWVEQSKEEPTKHPNSRRHRRPPNNNSSRKLKQTPHTNRVPTHLSAHSLRVWRLANTPFSDNLVPGPDPFLIPTCFCELSDLENLPARVSCADRTRRRRKGRI